MQDGLVERSTDPQDGRATRLASTAAGRRRAQAWLRDYERAAEDVFAPLPVEQWSVVLDALRTLCAGQPPSAEE